MVLHLWINLEKTDCSIHNMPGSSVHGDSPGKNTGVGCHFVLRGIFLTQGSNSGLPHCSQILYQSSHQGNLRILESVANPFFRGSSWPRNQTRVSCIASRFFTSWATSKALLLLRLSLIFKKYFYFSIYCFCTNFVRFTIRYSMVFKIKILMGTIFKVFTEFVTLWHLFYVVWFFGWEAHGNLAPWPEIKPTLPALEGDILTTGLQGSPLFNGFWVITNNNNFLNFNL